MKLFKLLPKVTVFFVSMLIMGMSSANVKLIPIKVAILDNFHFQPYITNKFGERYINGIKLANFDLKDTGYVIKYKTFDYDRTHPLAILKSIKEVKAWHPDIVLGPRNSNMFLLTRGAFKNIMVLSAFATSNDIKTMPSNYYSLMFPDSYMARAMFSYVKSHYPNKKVFAVVESNCKNCVDSAKSFSKFYNKHNSSLIIKDYLQDNITNLDIQKLMLGYREGDIIFLPNTAYTTAILMLKITNYLNRETIFLGGDGWGAWQNTEVAKLKARKPYFGLHFTPASLDVLNDPTVNRFKREYQIFYKKIPTGDAALLSYNAIHSVVAALLQYGSQYKKYSLRMRILKSYQKALQADHNWYRPKEYAVYKVNYRGAKYLTSVPITTSGESNGG